VEDESPMLRKSLSFHVEASLRVGSGQGRLGLRFGNSCMDRSMDLQRSASPEEAEAEACLRRIKLAVGWIRQPTVIIESDCLTLIKVIESTN
jgi:hypothetical protein